MNLIDERTIALAGVLQACDAVRTLARTGEVNQSDIDPLMKSVLVLDAVSTPSVYGGLAEIRSGLLLIQDGILSSPQGASVEILRYVMAILHLQNQLYRDQQKFAEFGEAVERLSGHSGEELTAACSEVYQTYLSGMRPQIIVQGEQDFLQRPDVPPMVRSLLLAAVRSAVLWQQKDGTRFKLLWQRTRMQNSARSLLAQIVAH